MQANKLDKFVPMQELAEYSKQVANFKAIKLEAHKFGMLISFSQEALDDTGYNLESEDLVEGSFLFDAIAPCVAELYEVYLYIDELEKRVYADTAYGEYVDKRCAEHGIYRKTATH